MNADQSLVTSFAPPVNPSANPFTEPMSRKEPKFRHGQLAFPCYRTSDIGRVPKLQRFPVFGRSMIGYGNVSVRQEATFSIQRKLMEITLPIQKNAKIPTFIGIPGTTSHFRPRISLSLCDSGDGGAFHLRRAENYIRTYNVRKCQIAKNKSLLIHVYCSVKPPVSAS
ncbi:hypothetical protein ACRALDRAFT_207337 [Sodiomyces alcalophilus JCM 7366]|uniref:uncharacterized protein n=1 Tax=Sodiomyces alcalophilus JCM 7366 TaxID=591952 RepID=UPI0039B6A500